MSRRTHRPRVYLQTIPDNNPYQPTTLPHHTYVNEKRPQPSHGYQIKCTNLCSNGCERDCTAALSDDTFADTNTYYDYYLEKQSAFSDDSVLPHYEEVNRHSRFSDRSFRKVGRPTNQVPVHLDARRVFPNPEEVARLYHEVVDVRCSSDSASNLQRQNPRSRLSDRPQSSLSSGVTSAVVYGCGGKCQTFENVCYYFLQVAFTMGILIGSSLCIAGAVLRKSAARNLQVLVYIGAMLSLVSALLLGVQCNARNSARKRQKAIRNAKMRAPIPMDTLPTRGLPSQLQQPLVVSASGGAQGVVVFQQRGVGVGERPGVPWWRRKDLDR